MAGLTDKALVRERFRRTLGSYAGEAAVQRAMAQELVSMAARHASGIHFERVLEVGSGSGMLTELMLEAFSIERYTANDLVEESRECLQGIMDRHPEVVFNFLGGDVESLPFLPERRDLVVSNATLQWLDDLETFLGRIADSMAPGGLFLFTSFSSSNMQEIAAILGTALTYRSIAETGELCERYFEVLELREAEITLTFSSPEAVLRHISRTGVNALARKPWTKGRQKEFSDRYRSMFSQAEGVRLTYNPVYCCLRKRQEGSL
ncbi:malonyl-ACP O-methyltransferase BioC [Pelodictyon luteolum]|uniref:Malonyl-[acyl-carrier protein] O-methyltransferase n=1 Tax=Chlorobium luteolum (strain DSM 273 / BCRC 81028 / 2530) TaxID=319225 RepID=BIOC_CHLL3|nr:malonyl-ACP O-methyltransferase BioC [Pelodictyon luteolum]Q3B172.1 RecName: Full=Malonyl-[acyl-carrier protein] O-methyltransferase; Short=Malonyl-ACP O-methyltransferase; AltName: Full=Biotin synthesis protein BioC [Pelodictyon luteolum DSM 273]ABB24909.1 Biotin biosynthesis protein BioC [Pelodictyon luteolum DSM 273]